MVLIGDLPYGFRVLECRESSVVVNFLLGGHCGGEGQIEIPNKQWVKFCDDARWREEVINEYSRILYYGPNPGYKDIPEAIKRKTGIIPDTI